MDNNPAAQFNPEAFLTDAMEGFDMSQIANAAYGSDTALSTTSANTSSVQLSDFTKRKNWPIRILSELKDFLHVVSPTGKFLFCSPSCQEMVGFSPQELVGLSVANFIHVDDVDSFISNFNLALSQNSFSMFYRFRKRDDKFILLEVNGHPYTPEGSTTPNCFFITARPYPSKSASMLDSFLELRIENEILTWKLKELRREAEENHVSNDNFLRPEFIPKKTLTDVEASSLVPSSASASTTLNSAPVELDILKAKRKKSKVAEGIHVCTDCGTVDSPEWRKGPHGPKTLCNACGLRYTKKSRKANEAAAETNN